MVADKIHERLAEIDAALDDGSYKTGMWQGFVRAADTLAPTEKYALRDAVSAVSRKLHARHGFVKAPFGVAFVAEIGVLALGLILLGRPELIARLAGVVALALTLQPTLKIVAGLLLGVRYDYAFLWYLEPRFKMRYGSYFVLPPAQRVWFHLAGSVGTPVALFVGAIRMMAVSKLFGYLCLALGIGALLMQVGAFAAQWMGVRKVGGFALAQLTSPATAASEWRRMRTGQG